MQQDVLSRLLPEILAQERAAERCKPGGTAGLRFAFAGITREKATRPRGIRIGCGLPTFGAGRLDEERPVLLG